MGGRSQDEERGPRVKGAAKRGLVAQPTPKLDGKLDSAGDGLESLQVVFLFPEGRVEIDDVEAFSPLIGKAFGSIPRASAEDGLLLPPALIEPNTFAALEINRWDDEHA